MRFLLCVAVAACLLACNKDNPQPTTGAGAKPMMEPAPAAASAHIPDAASPTPTTAADFRFDGFRLGDSYADVFKRTPYTTPCDDDPIDRAKTIRSMVYGGLPCRGMSFPDKTTTLFFFAFEDPDQFDKPIEAFAWLGGSYFAARSNSPLQLGAPAKDAIEVFGPPITSFEVGKRVKLRIQEHKGSIFSIIAHDTVVGIAVGALSTDPQSGYWEVITAMYRRYTPRPETI